MCIYIHAKTYHAICIYTLGPNDWGTVLLNDIRLKDKSLFVTHYDLVNFEIQSSGKSSEKIQLVLLL